MDAVQLKLICDVETVVAVSPAGVVGGVVSTPAITVTIALCVAVPPAPVQARVYVPVVVRLASVCVPDVALVPDHALDAVQEVALVLDQVSVDELPLVTDVGDAERVMVGKDVCACVVALTLAVCAELFPAASLARTV